MTSEKGLLAPRVEYYVDGEVGIPIDVKREMDTGKAVDLNLVIKSNNGQMALLVDEDEAGKKHEEFRRIAGIRTRKTKEDFFKHQGKKIRHFPVLVDYVATRTIAIPKQAVHDHTLNKTSEWVATYNFLEEDNKIVMFPCDDTIESQEDEYVRLNMARNQATGSKNENDQSQGSTSKKE